MPPLPSLHFLRYFYGAAKRGNMSKAAKELLVSQSSISQGISKLEKELGQKLTVSSKNRFQLTEAGKRLLVKCEEIFSVFSELNDLFQEQEGVYQGEIKIAATHSFALSVLPSHLKLLLDQHPQIKPILRLGHSGWIRELVKQGEVDLGIMLAAEESYPGFHAEKVDQGEHHLFLPPDSKREERLSRLIISSERREDHILMDHLRSFLDPLPPIIEVLSWEVIARLVEQGLGVGFLPDYVGERYGLLPFSPPFPLPPIPYSILAIHSRDQPLTRNGRLFTELLKESLSQKKELPRDQGGLPQPEFSFSP